ncbi:MAG: hypothetical protein Q9225_007029 [Loekoesia sp. 1 TL-2023]
MSYAYRPSPHDHVSSHATSDIEHVSVIDAATPVGEKRRHEMSALSLDDIEAAQALEGLRADFGRTPIRRHDNGSDTNIDPALRSSPSSSLSEKHQEAEPLLSLVTSQHPLLSSAINGSLSAYTSSKSYSPRFKYGAELVERHIGSPVATTVTTASRITGVDSAARWYYQRSEPKTEGSGSERRRVTDDNSAEQRDLEQGYHDGFAPHPSVRRDSGMSMGDAPSDQLPSYDAEERSPTYQRQDPLFHRRQGPHRRQDHCSQQAPTWRSQLATTTSGLGVAMNDESLKSLKYCLSWLRWANNHLGRTMTSLKDVIQEYHDSHQGASGPPKTDADGDVQSMSEPKDQGTATQRMHSLKADITHILKDALAVVSTYAGGALPENARELVRNHLLSLPFRWFFASPRRGGQRTSAQNTSGQSSSARGTSNQGPLPESGLVQNTSTDSERCSPENELRSARRVLILAAEGLEMLTQISGIVDGTIDSAENWLERWRRIGSTEGRQREQEQQKDEKGHTEQTVLDEKDPSVDSDENIKVEEKEDVEMR